MANNVLNKAKKAKHDEFYTQKWDIEQELTRYRNSLTGKAIYCNCDDPITSRFWKYFYRQFGFLQLKQLIATHYNMDGSPSYALIYRGGSDAAPNFDENVEKVQLKGNGDFRSDECIEYLKQSDVVVTNPPFSLFREFVKQLMDYNKKFVIWGNQNAITYKEFFPLLMHNKVWIGGIANKTCVFRIPNNYPKYDKQITEEKHDGNHYAKVPAISTFTNLPVQRPTDQVVVFEYFDFAPHPAYDNYPAFEVSKVEDIPADLEVEADIDSDNLQGWIKQYKNDLTVLSDDGTVAHIKVKRPIYGVPITFMTKYNPSSIIENHNLGKEFDILGLANGITWNSINKVDDFKEYKNAKAISPKGKISSGGTINTHANYVIDNPTGTYYTANNANGKLKSTYARILIRVKSNITKF